ncbi:MAG: Smr/MutS family protein [Gemmatimonadetes bacterium]|nr:Smr/MutS family protein [Gemmatimonadota bacterium]
MSKAASLSFSSPLGQSSLDQLEFRKVLRIIGKHAITSFAREALLERIPSTNAADVERALETVSQLAKLLRDGDGFTPYNIPDIRRHLEVLGIEGSVLEASALIEIGSFVASARATCSQLQRIEPEAPILGSYRFEIPPPDIEEAIDRSFDSDGKVSDSASTELARTRSKVRDTRKHLVALLEDNLRAIGGAGSPRAATVTVRGGRYVIPVRREAKSRVGGIVHGESASGATLFVEPAAAVEMGNELTSWEAREKRAELAILRELTERLRPYADVLDEGWRTCVSVDEVYACARYAAENGSVRPQLAGSGERMALRNAKHPILVDGGVEVVPFTFELGGAETVLLLSGPNAGGKTVLLKTTGLVCALAQCGVIPPVGEGTVLPVLNWIFTDIGDNQSISASLSTYSAHLEALKAVLEGADRRGLVLIDELGTGTDPHEGAALAGAALQELCRRGPLTLATTHLNKLKDLAASRPDIVNASLRFDEEHLKPTYELVTGVPGRSYGLAIAKRLGMAAGVLSEAESLLDDTDRKIEELLADLEDRDVEVTRRERASDVREKELAAGAEELARLRGKFAARDEQLSRIEKQLDSEGREKARKFLLQARRRVEDALALARAAVDEATAREARGLVEEGVRDESTEIGKLSDKFRAKGWKVNLGEQNAVGGERGVAERTTGSAPGGGGGGYVPVLDAVTEINLRGMSGEEASRELELALDAAITADLGSLRIIHGKGNGVLRSVTHEALARDARVSSFGFALPNQGGTGVTVAELRP